MRDKYNAEIIANKFLESLRLPFVVEGTDVFFSPSIGVAVSPSDGETIDELLRHADIAMYHVKGQGKNRVSFFENSMLDASHLKITLEQNLRRALEQDELEMYYQRQIDS